MPVRRNRPQTQPETGCASGLDLVVDYGWLTVVAAPIFWALEAIHKLVGNWGWAIVVLTIMASRPSSIPLSAASYKSMAKMKLLTPRLMQLKERFGDDKQRLNQEMMKLYQTEKVNPLGGCLPILVQIPVFIALYWVLLGAVEMRDAPWIMWIKDLASADPYYILPVIMMASMFVQTKLNPTPPDPIQAKVMMMMPLIFGVMFFWFPAGLVLYWVVNNVLSIAQQWQITRMIDAWWQGCQRRESLRCEPADTIAAIATAPGRGGVGVIRISGSNLLPFAFALTGKTPKPRYATLADFKAADGNATVDSGILLFFPGPHSFTGEDVLELQGHGGPVVMQMLLARCLDLGARLAEPANSAGVPSSTARWILRRPRRWPT
jgi:YidC/Oxa1 family membrane protein insertase